ncbi:transcriptional regulator [Undibacterium sp. CY18W]|uniref:Transcriptional regulator n=1 Tax=Undibacterium hunanense TaxID=2762292 RepID=A0ABR6ZQG8_9BURK|nr:transcriptional regulator [Undibacterium hunanense]MBC3918122.1 transcriptional regulator [Undibacterium hunanense]
MDIRPIHTQEDYKRALAEVSRLVDIDPEVGTPDGDKLEVLATLVELYEAVEYPATLPSPIDAIKFRMEMQGLRPADMTDYFGSPSKTSEVLNGHRSLSIQMIRKLHKGLGMPLEILVQEVAASI